MATTTLTFIILGATGIIGLGRMVFKNKYDNQLTRPLKPGDSGYVPELDPNFIGDAEVIED